MTSKFNNIALFAQSDVKKTTDTADELAAFLGDRGCKVMIATHQQPAAELLKKHNVDLAIVIGGDGSLMHAARELADLNIPLVGVNLGRLGFLTDIAFADRFKNIEQILDGGHRIEERSMLSVKVATGSKPQILGLALNDVVIAKGESEQLIELQTDIDGEFVTRSRADGVIIATPTGSTAYALSAGGPILQPQLNAMIMVPICPHTLSNRPLAFNDSSTIVFTPIDINPDAAHVSLDGQIKYSITGDEKIEIRRARQTVKLIRVLEHNHYSALRSKLGWGEHQ